MSLPGNGSEKHREAGFRVEHGLNLDAPLPDAQPDELMADLFSVLGLELLSKSRPSQPGSTTHAENGIDPAAIVTGRDAILAIHGRGCGEHATNVALAVTDHAVDQPFAGRDRGASTGDDRARLEAIVADRNRRQKHVERARIVLLSANGVGTLSIMRQVGCAKATVWRWQARFMAAGVDGLLRDKSRPPGKAPLPEAVVERVIAFTLAEPPGEATHWTGRARPRWPGSACARCSGSGLGTACSRIASSGSSSPRTPSSRPSCGTSSACTSIHPPMPWCSRSTRRAKFKPSIAPNQGSP